MILRYLETPNPNHERFILYSATEPEVEKETQELDISKAIGVDEISPKILKWSSVLLTPILTKLFNMCIMSGIYPDSLKIARVNLSLKVETKMKVHCIGQSQF